MSIEANLRQEGCTLDYTAAVAVTGGEVIQLADGRAAVAVQDIAAGATGAVMTEGVYDVAKTASIVFLDGGRVFWDHSANAAHFKPVNDRDFHVGVAVGDAASAATTVRVNLNVRQSVTIDALNGPSLSVATGTQALGGFLPPQLAGRSRGLTLTATNEAQCVDLLSVDRVAVGSNPILEAIFRPAANGSTNAVDFSIGFANGTSTTDADAVTEHCLVHIDGGSTAINAQSKDGTTTVTATDTTKTISAGSAVANRTEVWMDARDPADVQIYIDGVLVLGSTVFALGAATGPLGALAHLEKSTGTATAGPFWIDRLIVRTAQQ